MTQVRFFPPLRFPYEQPPFPVYRSSITDTSPLLDFPRISLPVFFGRMEKKKNRWPFRSRKSGMNEKQPPKVHAKMYKLQRTVKLS